MIHKTIIHRDNLEKWKYEQMLGWENILEVNDLDNNQVEVVAELREGINL